jgi:hypothetical protein
LSATKLAEEIRACTDAILSEFDESPGRSFVPTLAERRSSRLHPRIGLQRSCRLKRVGGRAGGLGSGPQRHAGARGCREPGRRQS